MSASFLGDDPEPPARVTWRKLVRHRAARVFLVRGLGMVALFGLEITLARRLGVSGYGIFSFALAIATVVSRLAPLGWLNASTRYISAYSGSGQFGLLKGALISSHMVTGFGLAISALLVVLLGWVSESAFATLHLSLVLPLMITLTLIELHRFVLRGLHVGDLGEALPVLVLPSVVAASMWIMAIDKPGVAIYTYCALSVPLILVSAVVIIRQIPQAVWEAVAEFRLREWSLAALAMLVGGLSDELSTRMAVIVLGTLGNEQEAGLYQAASRLALLCLFLLRVLTPVAAPQLSALYHQGKFSELRALFRRNCMLSLLGALPFFLLFQVGAESVLSLFGPEFPAAGGILRLLSLAYLVSAASGPCATALMMIGRERTYGMLAATNFLLIAVGSYVLAQYFGGIGAAIATASSIIITNVLYLTIFLRETAPAKS